MDSPALPMDIKDINVCLLSAKKTTKSVSSPSLRELDQMSLCNFSMEEPEAGAGGGEENKPASEIVSRKRRREDDLETQSCLNMSLKEPRHKRLRRPLAKAFSPIVKHAKNTIKRSMSFSKEKETSPGSRYKIPGTPNQPKKRASSIRVKLSQNWVESVEASTLGELTKQEITRQEAIYSVYRTESELVDDLKMVVNIFLRPMIRLGLISEEDHSILFGNVESILSLHQELLSELSDLRKADGCFNGVGQALLQWSQKLTGAYADYCAHLVGAKHKMEALKHEKPVQDFLQRCLDSEFSRKLDLWSFLDAPRSRIMKYPIMLKEIHKKTRAPDGDNDCAALDQAMKSFESVLKEIDHSTGIAKCLDVISRLDFLHDEQKLPEIEQAKFILCSGQLKNKSGTKMHAFLFDTVFVLARTTTRTSSLTYQVYRQPVPVDRLVLEDVADGEAKMTGGSFRGTLNRSSSGSGCRHAFKISCSDPEISRHTYTLQASGDFDKKIWMDAFRGVVPLSKDTSTETTV